MAAKLFFLVRHVVVVAGLVIGASACQDNSESVDQVALTRACPQVSSAPVKIPQGNFMMGQEDVYPEEGPIKRIALKTFWMDPHEVTNKQFATFVAATGYITVAEKPVDPGQFKVPAAQIPPDMLKAGSAVFVTPKDKAGNYLDWWRYIPGANWRKPNGPEGADHVPEHPVVHLAFDDMQAYATWAKGRLPTEAQWEYAARAGAPVSSEQPKEANSWDGIFPVTNLSTDGFVDIAPVACYKANSFGLHDMVGNVWEMTSDYFAPGHNPMRPEEGPTGPSAQNARDPLNPDLPSRVIKGGSYLCAANYCQRYRPAGRQARDPGLGTSNVGFRLVYDNAPAG